MFNSFVSYLVSPQASQGEGKMQKSLSVYDSHGSTFAPLVVIELVSETKEEAIAWLLNRVRDKQQDGGTVH
jgi:hypothetical protein